MRLITINTFAAFLCLFTLCWDNARGGFVRGTTTIRSPQALQKSTEGKVWWAIVSGQARSIPKDIKEKFQHLGLSHLLTPSGLHLNFLLKPWTKLFSKKIYILPFIFFILVISLFMHLYALHRVGIIKFIRIAGMSKTQSLGLGLLFEGIAISWWFSPMSFCLSWAFLGVIYLSQGKTRHYWIFASQVFITYCFSSSITVFVPIINFFIIPLFSIVFPLLIIAILIPNLFPLGIWLVQKLITLLILIHENVTYIPLWKPNLVELGFLFCIFHLTTSRGRQVSLILLLLSPNQITSIFSRPTQSMSQNEFISVNRDIRCQRLLKGDLWEEKCRTSKKRSGRKIMTL